MEHRIPFSQGLQWIVYKVILVSIYNHLFYGTYKTAVLIVLGLYILSKYYSKFTRGLQIIWIYLSIIHRRLFMQEFYFCS